MNIEQRAIVVYKQPFKLPYRLFKTKKMSGGPKNKKRDPQNMPMIYYQELTYSQQIVNFI